MSKNDPIREMAPPPSRDYVTFPAVIRHMGHSYYVTIPGVYLGMLAGARGDLVDVTVALPRRCPAARRAAAPQEATE